MALGMLNGLTLPEKREDADYYHKVMEAIKLAFADTKTYVADPRYMKTKVSELLSPDYLAARRALITDKALEPKAGDPHCGGTIYLCTADAEGNMVSLIQSNYCGFARASPSPARASRFRTAARTSRSTRRATTIWRAERSPTTRSSQAFCSRTARPSARSA